jgi:hypothetical protein
MRLKKLGAALPVIAALGAHSPAAPSRRRKQPNRKELVRRRDETRRNQNGDRGEQGRHHGKIRHRIRGAAS